MDAFIAAMCLTMGIVPCPPYESTEAKPTIGINGSPAWAVTSCGLVWDGKALVARCALVFHKDTLESTLPVGKRYPWNVGQNLVIHELCHVQTFMRDQRAGGHRNDWKRCMSRNKAWGATGYTQEGFLK